MIRLERLNKILDELNLSNRERQIYFCLLEFKQARLQQIIDKTNLQKSTVHQVLNNLIKRGVLYSDNKKYDKNYSLYPPKKLLNIIANKRRKVRRLELEMMDILPELNSLYRLNLSQPKVEIYTNKDGFAILADKSLEVKSKVIYYLGDLDNLYQVLGKEYDSEHYIPARLKNGIDFKLLTYNTPVMRQHKKRDKLEKRETRFLPEDMHFENTILIFDETVIFYSTADEGLALSVTSPSIAQTQLTIFHKLWEMSE